MESIKSCIKLFYLICSILFITSCSTKITSIKEDKDIHLTGGEGYLLMAVNTNVSLDKVFIDGVKNIVLSKDDLRYGTNFILVNLPSGNYEFSKIRLNSFWQIRMSDDIWNFKIKPGTITYIGHLTVKDTFWGLYSKLSLDNKSTEALEFMDEKFPEILSSRKIEFGREEKDRFFDLVKNGGVK